MVEHLNAGLSDEEMDALVAPLGITLPAEAKQWWGYANGVPRGAPGDVGLTATLWWAPLEEIVQQCEEMRAIGSEGVAPGEPNVYKDSWLPIVIGDGMLVIDTSESLIAPVYAIDFPDLGPDVTPTPDLPSLGALIHTWSLRWKNERSGTTTTNSYSTSTWTASTRSASCPRSSEGLLANAMADHIRYRNGPHRDQRLIAAERKLLVAA